jgi:hypothetical protein
MTKLKLGPIADNKPVKVTVELPADIHRALVAYAELLSKETGQTVGGPGKLISPMIERFMATDRGFAKARRVSGQERLRTAPSDRPERSKVLKV